MTKFVKAFSLALAALVLSATLALAAISLDTAKQQGLVGEQPDGLLGIVAAAPSADVTSLVATTNAERLERYKAIAAKNNTDLAKVQALAGQKLVDQTPAGEYVLNAGAWQKK